VIGSASDRLRTLEGLQKIWGNIQTMLLKSAEQNAVYELILGIKKYNFTATTKSRSQILTMHSEVSKL
jgi:hypothetical protein